MSWECILWLLMSDLRYWFYRPLSIHQIVSWLSLAVSLALILPGGMAFIQRGKHDTTRKDESLFEFEKTTQLVQQGIFKYIRHPMYGSLLFLTWGILFKNPTLGLVAVSLGSTVFLYLTAIMEEKEDIRYFGKSYIEYMKRTKMFIPYFF